MTQLIKWQGPWGDTLALSHNNYNQYIVVIGNDNTKCSFILNKQQAMKLAQELIKTDTEDAFNV